MQRRNFYIYREILVGKVFRLIEFMLPIERSHPIVVLNCARYVVKKSSACYYKRVFNAIYRYTMLPNSLRSLPYGA
jgi:hypothetical protein